jgi:hypothetical protein
MVAAGLSFINVGSPRLYLHAWLVRHSKYQAAALSVVGALIFRFWNLYDMDRDWFAARRIC